jgi:hypothetical protein
MDKHQTNSQHIRFVMVWYTPYVLLHFHPLFLSFSQGVLIPCQNTYLTLLPPIQCNLSKRSQPSKSVWVDKHLHPSIDDMDSTTSSISCRGFLHSDYRKLFEVGSRGAETSWLLILHMRRTGLVGNVVNNPRDTRILPLEG